MTIKFRPIIAAAVLALAAPPLMAEPRGDEPIAVPTSIKQGVDFVYVDPQLSTVAVRHQKPRKWLARVFRNAPEPAKRAPNLLFDQLQQGLQAYEQTWGALPQTKIPAGPALKPGSKDKRVALLRARLGLAPSGGYDSVLGLAVTEYQRVHGLTPSDGIAGKGTIASLNLGADFYEKRIAINMERAFRLPQTQTFDRYVVIDSGSAEAWLFQGDRLADSMPVVVGAAKTKTPIMAVLMRDAKVHPYWNVPPELIRSLTAARIKQQGLSYLDSFHYEVLANWNVDAPVIDPHSVDWKRIASGGDPQIRVRQLPGPWNSMGDMKFEMPNDFGIYLHDSPHKELFAASERHLSNGCVRLSDYRRFASWVFGRMPQTAGTREEKFDLPRPIPVYMTYLTVSVADGGLVFRPDIYGEDALAMPQMDFTGSNQVAMAREGGRKAA